MEQGGEIALEKALTNCDDARDYLRPDFLTAVERVCRETGGSLSNGGRNLQTTALYLMTIDVATPDLSDYFRILHASDTVNDWDCGDEISVVRDPGSSTYGSQFTLTPTGDYYGRFTCTLWRYEEILGDYQYVDVRMAKSGSNSNMFVTHRTVYADVHKMDWNYMIQHSGWLRTESTSPMDIQRMTSNVLVYDGDEITGLSYKEDDATRYTPPALTSSDLADISEWTFSPYQARRRGLRTRRLNPGILIGAITVAEDVAGFEVVTTGAVTLEADAGMSAVLTAANTYYVRITSAAIEGVRSAGYTLRNVLNSSSVTFKALDLPRPNNLGHPLSLIISRPDEVRLAAAQLIRGIEPFWGTNAVNNANFLAVPMSGAIDNVLVVTFDVLQAAITSGFAVAA